MKAIQLYEMIVLRHGLMLVGQSYGMKSSVYKTLAAALTGECAGVLEHEVGLAYASCPCHVVWHGSLAPRRTACMREWLLVLTPRCVKGGQSTCLPMGCCPQTSTTKG